jgi:hypothetical protein
VGEDVEAGREGQSLGHAGAKFGIDYGQGGKHAAHAGLLLGVRVGDYREAGALAARTARGRDGDDRQEGLAYGRFAYGVAPDRARIRRRYGDALCAVHRGAAAQADYEGDAFLPRQGGAFVYQRRGGVRDHAVVDDGLYRAGGEDALELRGQAAFRRPCVADDHGLPSEGRAKASRLGEFSGSKGDFRRGREFERVHSGAPCFIYIMWFCLYNIMKTRKSPLSSHSEMAFAPRATEEVNGEGCEKERDRAAAKACQKTRWNFPLPENLN